jgi:hypothetical protein
VSVAIDGSRIATTPYYALTIWDLPREKKSRLPTDRRNPGGRRAITGFSLAFAHRTWVDRMPVLRTADGVEYDKSKIVLYAYRHSYRNATPTPACPSKCYVS